MKNEFRTKFTITAICLIADAGLIWSVYFVVGNIRAINFWGSASIISVVALSAILCTWIKKETFPGPDDKF